MSYPLLRLASLLVLATLGATLPAGAQSRLSCLPCAGLTVEDPAVVIELLAPRPPDGTTAPLTIKWHLDLETPVDAGELERTVERLTARGARAWLTVHFHTPPPLLENGTRLATELDRLSQIARAAGDASTVQIAWDAGAPEEASEYAFLLKRASVAVTGAQPDAVVVSQPGAAEESVLRALYDQDTAAYLDAVAVGAIEPSEVERLAAVLRELDPGASLVVDGVSLTEDPLDALPIAARYAARGAELVLFRLDELDSVRLAPFRLLQREFAGDLSLDPYSAPRDLEEAWSFVRGEDLHLRVIVRRPAEARRLELLFPDRSLSSPRLFEPGREEGEPLFGGRRLEEGYALTLEEPPAVVVLGFERLSAAQLAGMEEVEEEVLVESERGMPVEEILRRLQAFEDAQARRLDAYRATNTTHLRFQFGTGSQAVETTFRGAFFFRQGEGFDWAWEEFLINGVRWRRKSIPKIPLIQPEKATALPGEITFTREYRYALRGTGTVDGRDCWVVDFAPAVSVEPGESLYKGTVWVDREIYARLRTRAVQLGLEGEVISNEETIHYSPIDAAGNPGGFDATSYFLPLRVVGQQLWSVLDATVVVERETLIRDVALNPTDFEEARQAALSSEATMVRDTDEGLRYLVTDKETGERVVEEELDPTRLFVVGGLFYDESQDYPIPLAGVNWLSFDWRGTGGQANVFFAGPLLLADLGDPSLLGSKFTAGVDVFALAVPGSDVLFRNGEEVEREEVEQMTPNIDLSIGRPLGSFFKLDFEYSLGYTSFSRADSTDEAFVLPRDHLRHRFSLVGRYNRGGYRFRLGGSTTLRDTWEPWGLPGTPELDEFDPETEQYELWGASLAKIWHLPRFRKFGLEVEYVDGADLDRFSKYTFGYFSDVRVHGYQSDKVRAEDALAAHLTYGFDLGELLRLDLVADAAWASDDTSGLDRDFLDGVGIAGTFVGPWATVVNLDLGAALAGPDDGFSVFVAFLKLFGGR